MRLGLDIGSTTIKCTLIDNDNSLVYKTYTRHYSHIKETLLKVLDDLNKANLIKDELV